MIQTFGYLFNGLTNLAHHNPPMGMIDKPEAVAAAADFIAAHPARFIFVAMGPPQSELLCHRLIQDGRATGVGLCIGSSLSVRLDQNADWLSFLIDQLGMKWAP